MDNLIQITSGRFTATINPSIGGSLTSWTENVDGKEVDLMRHALPESVEKKAADMTAMFPLVPYSNRIRGGSFIYWGIKRIVPKNHPFVADPLHGEGWQREWHVVEQSATRVVIQFEHNGKDGFPFSYQATETFEVEESKLTVSLKLTNKGGIPMPCGLGWHPFFEKDPDTIVQFKNKTLWAHEALPPREKPIKVPPEWAFESGKNINGLDLDTCFGGFDGKVEITWPSKNRRITMTALHDFGHVIVWTPQGENFFCVEPVTNATDAFNLASRGVIGTGIKTIEPEESLSEKLIIEKF